MKNVLKNALLVLSLCTGFLMEAAENLDIKVLNGQNLKVELIKGDKGDVLLLKDSFGKVLFRDSVGKTATYQKVFNLELVPSGIYYLNLDKESSLLVTLVKKTENGLEINNLSEFVFKPCFKIENKQVKVLLSNPKELKAEMKVYDSNGTLVGSLNSKDLVVYKTLDFSKVPSGTYTVETKIDGQEFKTKLEIG